MTPNAEFITDGIASSGALCRAILRRHIRAVVPGTLLRANHQVMEALVPVVVGQVIDHGIARGDSLTFLGWLAVLVVNFVLLSGSWFFGARILERAGFTAEHQLRTAIARRVLDPAGGVDRDRLPGELLSIATSDAQRTSWILDLVAAASGAIAALLVATLVLLRISLPLGLLVLAGSVPLLALIQALGRLVHRVAEREQAQAAYAAGLANDFVNGLRVLKGFGGAPAAIARYREASRASLRANLRSATVQSAYDGASLLLTGAFLALVAYVGARLAADGHISIGDLIAALGLTQFLVGPMWRIAYVGSELAQIRASAARVVAVLAAPPAVVAPAAALSRDPTPSTPGGFSLRDVHCGTLRGVTFDVKPGEFVGIVAAEQSDGDALVALLGRTADPASGELLLDETPLTAIPLPELRRRVLVSPHNAYIFSGTLWDSVTASAPVPSDDPDGIAPVVEASSLGDVIATLPEGLTSAISEGGQSLSGGQRQRLALARALAADTPVLVLHEPATAVDSVTEARIARGIRALRAGHTTIVVTTSPSLLATADRIVVIDDGRVTDIAAHRELVAASGRYRALVLA